jgi:hypothetical protein
MGPLRHHQLIRLKRSSLQPSTNPRNIRDHDGCQNVPKNICNYHMRISPPSVRRPPDDEAPHLQPERQAEVPKYARSGSYLLRAVCWLNELGLPPSFPVRSAVSCLAIFACSIRDRCQRSASSIVSEQPSIVQSHYFVESGMACYRIRQRILGFGASLLP